MKGTPAANTGDDNVEEVSLSDSGIRELWSVMEENNRPVTHWGVSCPPLAPTCPQKPHLSTELILSHF